MESEQTGMAEASIVSLNDFPEEVLLHTLSFLPTSDAIQTTLLSRKWRYLWSSINSLDFSNDLFPRYDSPSQTLRSFADFINRTLILRSHSPLLKFRLQLFFGENRYASHVDSWVRYAVAHRAIDMDLSFFMGSDFIDLDFYNPSRYGFPFSALRNGCVGVLKLTHCYLSMPPAGGVSVARFPSLRSLCLDRVPLTDAMLLDLMLGCVNLEALFLLDCNGLKNAYICSSRLKELTLQNFTSQGASVDISAPNLRSLSTLFFEVGCIMDSSLSRADVYFMYKLEDCSHWSKVVSFLSNAQHLTVQNWWFKFLVRRDVSSGSFLLQSLKYLELRTGYSKLDLLGIAALLEISPNLETMILDEILKVDEETLEESNEESEKFVTPIKFSLPSLRQFKMKHFKATQSEKDFVMLLLQSEVVIEKIVLICADVAGTYIPPLVLVKPPRGFQITRSL
ncbi:hypothetical protein L1049_023434 [Liquidambar formosana]|uniref:F-box domain-containing protein n=1 Tax=Liquidambar formosana TaxID=63359 RepID=A0AAP0RUF8_LIQFO